MISALRMCRAAAVANCIISTAPIAKFGAMKMFAPASARSASSAEVKASRTDHHVHAGGDRFARVGHGGRRHGEVDEHIGALGQRLRERRVERRVDPRHELHVVGAGDGVTHRLAHPSRGTGDGDADRAHAL